MTKYIRSEKSPWGEIFHYDETGIIGESRPGILSGTMHHYTCEDGYVGTSYPGIFADGVTCGSELNFNGESYKAAFVTTHYDEHGYVGTSYEDDYGFDTYFD